MKKEGIRHRECSPYYLTPVQRYKRPIRSHKFEINRSCVRTTSHFPRNQTDPFLCQAFSLSVRRPSYPHIVGGSPSDLPFFSSALSGCGQITGDGRTLREEEQENRTQKVGIRGKKNKAWPCQCGRKSQPQVLGSIRPSPRCYAGVRYMRSIRNHPS